MQRDSQRSRVYGWEAAVEETCGGRIAATLQEIKSYPDEFVSTPGRVDDSNGVFCQRTEHELWDLAHKLRRQGGMRRMVTLRFTPSGRAAVYRRSEHTIILPRWAMTYWVLTHEMVHAMLPYWVTSHGPEFVGLLMHFMTRNCSVPLSTMVEEADRMGIKYVAMHPKRIRYL